MSRAAQRVAAGRYEPEGSDRRAVGSVSLSDGGWWTADLVVSIRRKDQVVLTLERHGAPGQEDGESAELCLRPDDLPALPALLAGVIAQARRDGVLG